MSGEGRPVPTAYSRVTLVNGDRRVDLALPGALPLADVMPQLLHFCAPDERPEQPAAWTLGRVGGPNLSLAQSLRDASVLDGEVLELRSPATVTYPAYVEDVRDAVEDAVDEAGKHWRPATTVAFSLVVSAALAAAAVLLPEAREPGSGAALALAVAVAALGVLAGWWASRTASWAGRGREASSEPASSGNTLIAQAVLGTGVLWGGVAGWLTSTLGQPAGADGWPESLAAALAGALVVALLARVLTTLATALATAVTVLCAAGLPAGLLASTGSGWLDAVRVDAMLAVLVVGVLPRVSLTVGGLASDDFRVRNFGLVTGEQLAARIKQSSALLTGGIAGIAIVGVATGLVLTSSDHGWDRPLGLAIGLALVLRSRVFSRIPHIVPLRVAGIVVLAAQGLRAVREDLPGVSLVAAVAMVCVVVVAASAVPLSEVARARVRQLLHLAEMGVVVAMVAVAGGALGGYDWIGRVTG
jgi:type VII secretion integral membrane protein EccD